MHTFHSAVSTPLALTKLFCHAASGKGRALYKSQFFPAYYSQDFCIPLLFSLNSCGRKTKISVTTKRNKQKLPELFLNDMLLLCQSVGHLSENLGENAVIRRDMGKLYVNFRC